MELGRVQFKQHRNFFYGAASNYSSQFFDQCESAVARKVGVVVRAELKDPLKSRRTFGAYVFFSK